MISRDHHDVSGTDRFFFFFFFKPLALESQTRECRSATVWDSNAVWLSISMYFYSPFRETANITDGSKFCAGMHSYM